MENINLKRYEEFVEEVTSVESNKSGAFFGRVQELEQTTGVNIPLLSSEGGEFSEIVKKCLFQGKPLNDETVFHLKRELGDIMWYWSSACRSLGLDPNEVIAENVKKLESRYPGGKFDIHHSENRQDGDL